MKKEEIIDFCLDNPELSENQLNQALITKMKSNGSLVKFNHQADDIFEACGINKERETTIKELDVPTYDKRSEGVEWLTKNFSSVELGIALMNSIQQIQLFEMKHKMMMMFSQLGGKL